MNAIFESASLANTPATAHEIPSIGCREALSAIFDAMQIFGPTRFQLGSHPAVDVVATTMAAAPQAPAKTWFAALTEAMWPELYRLAYARPFRPNPDSFVTPAENTASTDLLTQLRAVFPEGMRWDSYWQVYKTDFNGVVHVQKGDCCQQVMPGAFMLAQPMPGPVQVGAMVSVLIPTASSMMQPGFFHVTGTAPGSDHDNAILARLYLNTRMSDVVALMQAINRSLNAYAVPFRMKTLLSSEAEMRTDSTVLYVARRYLPFTLSLLGELRAELSAALHPAVPLFSKRLMDGLGGADDPGYGLSFGQARMMLLAEATIEAWAITGSQEIATRLSFLEQRFTRAGLMLDQPYLAAGNTDIYQFAAS